MLIKVNGEEVEVADASTIQDVIDETNAASWGLFDLKKDNWDREALKRLKIREEILPKILKSGYCR
jgi:sugar (pentulose or hexulose) kinase